MLSEQLASGIVFKQISLVIFIQFMLYRECAYHFYKESVSNRNCYCCNIAQYYLQHLKADENKHYWDIDRKSQVVF